MTKQNKYQDKEIKELKAENKKLRETLYNHISSTNQDIASIKSDIGWLKTLNVFSATAIIGGVIKIFFL